MANLFGVIFFPVLFLIPAAVLVILGSLWIKRIHLIAKKVPTPLDKLRPGFVKVEGKAGYIKPLMGPVSNEECVYYKYELQRLATYTRRSYRDQDEDVEVKEYQTYESGESKDTFYIMDGEGGQVKIIPTDATFYIQEIVKTDTSSNPPEWKHNESHIKTGDNLVAIGTATEDPSSAKGGHHIISKGKKAFLIISKKPEKVIFRLQLKAFMAFMGVIMLGVVCFLLVYLIAIA